MAKPELATVNVNSDTFSSWISATNSAIVALQNNAVTVSSNVDGDYVYGNGFVQGVFGANTLVATNIRGGNVQVSTNSAINMLSNVNFTGTKAAVNGYITIGQALSTIQTTNTTTTGTSQMVLDTFATTTYRTVKYVISIKDNVANNFQATEIMLMHSGGNVYMTEYATLISNGTVGQFSSNVASGNVNLLYTPSTANTTVNVNKIAVSV